MFVKKYFVMVESLLFIGAGAGVGASSATLVAPSPFCCLNFNVLELFHHNLRPKK